MSTLLKAAVMGFPVAQSLSPRLHSYWLKHYGIAGSYEALAIRPEELEGRLHNLSRQGYCGVNLTIPHKEAALTLVDHLDVSAKRIGAVNTVIVRKDGALEGRNTDAYGFAQNLAQSGFKPIGDTAVILGAGGAARAVIVALQDMGLRNVRLVNRTLEKAEDLAKEFSTMEQSHFLRPDEPLIEAVRHIHRVTAFAWADAQEAMEDATLLVNATSLGMEGQPPLDVSFGKLPRLATVTDIVYKPLQTDLLKRASARGHKTIDGLGMLLHQARPAFEAFFGKDPSVTQDLRAHVLGGA